ncbi:MAG: type II toxin-antitoxin system RelB/DinJ family antitoxin [Defluviitaleaceae bacterium]|nr:type II toxin-antitoxin system RelB/DinJ family antitoxin [Defluviitaleaceae bacterium]
MSILVSTRVDEATKQKFDRVCQAIGVSPSNALSMFISGVIDFNGIPFGPVAQPPKPPKMSREAMFGCMRGQITMSDDFDAPLEDFKEYME